MRDSADSNEYGVTRRGSKRGKFRYDEATYEKRDRHLPRLQAEDAHDAVDGLPEGDRWSTWDTLSVRLRNDFIFDRDVTAGRRVAPSTWSRTSLGARLLRGA